MTRNAPIAIVGFGGVFPSSPTLSDFWSHIVSGRDTARETPDHRWALTPDHAFDPNRPAPDRVYSKRACLVDDPGLIVDGAIDGLAIEADFAQTLDVMVQLVLRAGRDAWFDARMERVDRSRIGVILGNIALPTESNSLMADWVLGRRFDRELFATSQSAPAPINRFVTGLPAGILARALGLGGGHYAIDAACASSLFALELAMEGLRSGRVDAMLTGGGSRPDCLYTQMGFAQLTALSPSGRCSPFDRKGDGLVVGEGAGVFVLKRLTDALAQGDTIHAVIRGTGTSNDVDGNLLAPSQEGQLRAMHGAYREAGWDPRSLQLIECHATGTQVGDGVEFASLRALWGDDGFDPGQCTIGSVKSNVGHLLTGAGAAGLAKVLLAMRHQVLPATANFETAGEAIDLDGSPFVVRSESSHWQSEGPRRAAVSGFGFGGTNAHVLLEEWTPATRTSVSVLALPIDDEVVLVGMSATVGAWNGLEAFQHRVLGGGPEIAPAAKNGYWGLPDPPKGYFIDELEVPVGEFRIPPKEIQEMLPQQLLMLQVSERAMADAVTDTLDRLRTGVFIGIGLDLNTTNYHLRWVLHDSARGRRQELGGDDGDFDAWLDEQSDRLAPALTANRVMGNLGGMVASRVAREFAIGGPSYVVSSEEGSGFSALEAAVRGLKRGQIDCALVGAIDLCGDPRQTIASDAQKPMSRTGMVRPFDKAADGALPGEGAVALVLKRRRDAERDGDRIYATVRGLGSATGGSCDSVVPTENAYRRALANAYEDAGVDPASVGFVETHGSGHAPEDRVEARALNAWFHGTRGTVLGSAKADVGHTGAAGALVSIAKASLALHHRTLPPLRGINHPREVLKNFSLPRGAQYWLHDRDGAPRRAGVSSMSSTGHIGHVVLEAVDKAVDRHAPCAHPLGPFPEALFVIETGDSGGLLAGLEQLATLSDEAVVDDAAIDGVAQRWWQLHGSDPKAALGLALVARDPEELRRLIDEASAHLRDDTRLHSRRIFFSREPLGAEAEVAFVYPGSGSQYAGMGRELAVYWPGVLRAQEQECARLRSQLQPQLIWNDQELRADTQTLILAQVALGTVVSDLVRSFGVEPKAIIGYSLGETAGMFSLRAWHQRDEMLHRVYDSELFTTELCGPCNAAKRTWGLAPDDTVQWTLGVVDRPSAMIRDALAGVDRAYLLIVNTPDECVIGGDATAVRKVVTELACSFHELHGVTTVHCEVAKAVEQNYYDLHLLETVAPAGVRFYSGARGESFSVSQKRAAQSILDNALDGVDWPKTIQQAYSDGARIFLEMGPGASCTRAIEKILQGQRFVARAVCAQGQDGVSSILRTLATLVAERIPVDLGSLYFSHEPVRNTGACITVPVGRRPLARATRPAPILAPPKLVPLPAAVAGGGGAVTSAPGAGAAQALMHKSTAVRLVAASEASTRAHDAYLQLSTRVAALVTEQLRAHPDVVRTPEPGSPPKPVALDRDMCLEFARGSIAKVLGPEFAPVDAHPTRVRLPDEPLMLVDRILRLEGEPLSLTTGKVVTEHDVLEGAWYLDNGRIPTCIAVEAGQADLFLAGYLGIDFRTKGLACYRLLDAVVTFHHGLPGAGDVIHYDIDILNFFRQGDTWLFRFQFEASVDGVKLMTMGDGCAGFFSKSELAAGKGIVHSTLQKNWQRRELPADWRPLAPICKCALDAQQVEALRRGDLAAAFGQLFADLPVATPLTIPGGKMQLVHRVDEIDPHGGRYGIGFIRAQADIHPDDWFLTCHFVDDKVMPGTLMYECCLHTLRIYLLRMGWVTDSSQVVAQPITGLASHLKCRGQVLDTTKLVTYEVSIKELGYDPEPFAIVDALMFADGKPVVEISDMSLRLTGASREQLETLWVGRSVAPNAEVPAGENPAPFRPAIYDYQRILAFSNGKPSEAFGEPYRVFDQERKIARLPRPPFQFLDRIVDVQGQPFVMEAGAKCVAQVQVTPDQWYFASNRQADIPFAVLLEMALQPCGWLAAYVGSALQAGEDLKFRNLGGDAVQHRCVLPEADVLTTRVEMTGVSNSAGMIIQHFSFDLSSERFGSVYTGTTYFGFFSDAALADQLGVRDAEPYEPGEAARACANRFPVPTQAPFPDDVLRMVSHVDFYAPDGGPHGLGYIEGSIAVRPDFWFFDAHFLDDPVWPGSLGLEAFLQLMKVAANERWQLAPTAGFATMPTGARHRWVYRGQVVPTAKRVTVKAVITSIDDSNHRMVADGFLCVDGRTIYQMIDFALEARP
jgi:acyl transferase domain-containing protein/3-hydroxymyristoyl/3-hydroxydecanoyl-(acyl carrier protein) dehydratase